MRLNLSRNVSLSKAAMGLALAAVFVLFAGRFLPAERAIDRIGIAVPYAFKTGTAARAEEVNANFDSLAARSVPVGTILPFMGDASLLPSNWIPCDGRTVTRTTQFPHDRAPDLRSAFLRGKADFAYFGQPTFGGSDTYDLSHTHTVSIPSHTRELVCNSGHCANGFGNDNSDDHWFTSPHPPVSTSAGGTQVQLVPRHFQVIFIIRVQ